jgi:hypothetical protein
MSPREAIRALPTWAKVASIVASIALAGMVFGRDWASLPAQVEAHEQRLSEVEAVARRVDRQYTRLVCLLTLPDSLNGVEAERVCP